jgi:hypothetical protein
VDINTEDFREHFGMLSDATLLKTKREDLVDAAKTIFDQEIAHRGLNKTGNVPGVEEHAAEEDQHAEPGEETEAAENEPLVSVGSYTIVEEARLARGLLQIAGIPCGLQNEKSALGALHLMVPESHVGAALEVLGGEISEEELAAQAEAAGLLEEEFEEDETE